jgi:hypothetical protein
MSLNTAPAFRSRAVADQVAAADRSGRVIGDDFSTALFTSVNVAVFLVLTACVAGAAILYALGA